MHSVTVNESHNSYTILFSVYFAKVSQVDKISYTPVWCLSVGSL
jgi:hypothetical protein